VHGRGSDRRGPSGYKIGKMRDKMRYFVDVGCTGAPPAKIMAFAALKCLSAGDAAGEFIGDLNAILPAVGRLRHSPPALIFIGLVPTSDRH